MSEIPRVSLVDTLHLIQLARETALAQGAEAQADRLKPVVNEMQNLVTRSQKTVTAPATNAGVMGQQDFRYMLEAARTEPVSPLSGWSGSQGITERNQLIQSMSAADMTDLEIARQMEMTTEEVNLVLSIFERGRSGKEIAS